MLDQEKEQIASMIANIEKQKSFVPFLHTIAQHPVFGPLIDGAQAQIQDEIHILINAHISESIAALKTKGGQYFKRFFENNPDLFWSFRKLNEDLDQELIKAKDPEFQKIGKEVEHHIFEAEGLLTQKMTTQGQGLNKTLGAFYDIVYRFFPRYGEIE